MWAAFRGIAHITPTVSSIDRVPTCHMDGVRALAKRAAPFFDVSTLLGQSVALLVWYLCSIGFAFWAIAALSTQDPNAITPTAVGWLLPLFTGLVHLALLVTSYALIPGFVPYPIRPRSLFAFFDMLTGVMLGLSIGGIAANSLALLMVTNGLLVLTYLLACYKYWTIVREIRVGRRSPTTGARIK